MSTLNLVLDAGPANPTRRGYLAETYLPTYRNQLDATDRLRKLAWKRKPGPDQDALYIGYCAALRDLENLLANAAQIGGLPLMWEGSKALQGGAA